MYLRLIVIFILISCSSNPQTKDERSMGDSTELTGVSSIFMSDTEVEQMLSSKGPKLFSHFREGLKEDETIEVIRYLMSKGKMRSFITENGTKKQIFYNEHYLLKNAVINSYYGNLDVFVDLTPN